MNDLFEREQKILDNALSLLRDMEKNGVCSADAYANLVNEYRRLLKQLRRITKLTDKTAVDLNTSKRDLQDKVHYDELTGIYNRRFLDENLVKIMETHRRTGDVLSVLMVDVDFFKRYNDTYGHNAGDCCLRAVARSLKDSVRKQDDFVARYGGEEFAVVLPGAGEKDAREAARRILENVRALRLTHDKNTAAAYVTVSIGLTSAPVNGGSTPEDFLETADKALYHSKRNGRNRYSFYSMEKENLDDV